MGPSDLDHALTLLGDLLADRHQGFQAYAVGGGSLLLLGVIDRPTKDLDIVGLVRNGVLESAAPLPDELGAAVREVADLLGLPADWLNPGPAELLRFGLPAGYAARAETRRYGGLTLLLAGRFDQICFKLYAAVDQGPRSKHAADLHRLAPTPDDLLKAARWVRTHDPSEGFRAELHQALTVFGVPDHGDV